ncbi:uncharacterized protein TNIN_250721 [Trichonephila inaurata madagascariensis]|uniref:Uncharacterized protein n=1 Tax=Trichonephila inaurata madagascariensis TaxID=2747483 RepID=A0A8X6Y7A0_9ARAC|nr:uncharacterized protein TNIN_250721 [Trichonephila inaurata madagascariensis]
MILDFWPTLEVIAYARLSQAILYTFNLEFLKRRFMLYLNVHPAYSKAIEEKVNRRIIPTVVRKKLVAVVTSLGWEMYHWFDCHGHFFQNNNLDLRNKLHWFSFGIIDRQQTARNFIQDVNLNIRERFHLALRYCLEEEVHSLWTNMSPDNRFQETNRLVRTGTIEMWYRTLHENVPIDWEEIEINGNRNCFGSYLGLRGYFAKLRGSKSRYLCFYFALKSRLVHHFDLCSCIYQLNAHDEFNAVLTRLSDLEISESFKIFLHWPFQNRFLDVVTNFQGHINGHIFYELVYFILFQKLEGWQDYPYEKLFEGIWNLFPNYEDHVKNDAALYACAEYVLDNFQNFDRRNYLRFMEDVIFY